MGYLQLKGESVKTLRLRPTIPITGAMILQGAAQKLAIAEKRIRIVISLQDQEIEADR